MMFKQLCRLQRYTFLHDLPNVYNTFLHELSSYAYTFLHELSSFMTTAFRSGSQLFRSGSQLSLAFHWSIQVFQFTCCSDLVVLSIQYIVKIEKNYFLHTHYFIG